MGQAEIIRLSTGSNEPPFSCLDKHNHDVFSKELLELALKSSGDSVWYWNLETGKIKLDDSWIKKLGYDPNTFEFTFEWWNNSIKHESLPVFEKALSDYIEGRKEHYELEYQIKTKLGTWIWVWAVGKCIEYKKDGYPSAFIGTHRDITRLKNNEEKLIKLSENLELKVKERTLRLQTALKEINTLRGIIPICSYCKKIRDEGGSWNQLEKYISAHSDALFSHGICPECYKKCTDDLKKL